MITGIDCSKDFLDVALIEGNKVSFTGKFSNEKSGFKKLFKQIKDSKLVVMEATGPYYLPIAFFLKEKNIPVSVVNPLIIRRFCQMRLSRTKTDKKDAILIAQYGETEKPKPWEAPSNLILQIQQMETYLEGLKKRKLMVSNQLHSFKHSGKLCKALGVELEEEIQGYKKKILEKEKEIKTLLEKEYKKMLENLKSIPGIGDRSAILLTITTDGFRHFESYKQVIILFWLSSEDL